MRPAHLKSVLFTNLDYVTVNGVRTTTHALLLSSGAEGLFKDDPPRNDIVGFGSSCSWRVFDMRVPSIEYTLTPADSSKSMVMLQDDRTVKPVFSGGILQLKDGPTFTLLVHDYDQPIYTDVFEADVTDLETHSEFHQRVASAVIDRSTACCRTPAMGGAVYLPPTEMRALLRRFS